MEELLMCAYGIYVYAASLCRWVCTSGLNSDLHTTDNLAESVLEKIVAKGGVCACACAICVQVCSIIQAS